MRNLLGICLKGVVCQPLTDSSETVEDSRNPTTPDISTPFKYPSPTNSTLNIPWLSGTPPSDNLRAALWGEFRGLAPLAGNSVVVAAQALSANHASTLQHQPASQPTSDLQL